MDRAMDRLLLVVFITTVTLGLLGGTVSADILLKLTNSKQSLTTTVVLRPMQSEIVKAQCSDDVSSFVLFQAHSENGANVTLSYERTPNANESHSARNTGLLRSCSNAEVFLINGNSASNLTVLLIAVSYSNVDPMPGGCNMEFPVRTAPYLRLNLLSPTTIGVDFQRARAGTLAERSSTCEQSLLSLRYEIYHYYMSHNEDYHKALQLMSDVYKIRKHATRLHTTLDSSKTRNIFVAYPQNREIYAVVVSQRYRNGYTTAAAYVPIATLGCGDYSSLAACRTSTGSMIALALIIALSLCMTFAGHRFLKTQIILAAFVFNLLAFEPLMSQAASMTVAGLLALVYLILWYLFGVPVIAVIPSGFLLGLLMTAILFFTPIGSSVAFSTAFTYRTMSICVMLSVTTLMLPTTRLLSIVSSSTVGSFSTLYAIDRAFLHSTFSKIVDVARARFEMSSSTQNHTEVPFALVDVVLICCWLILSIIGVVVQYKTIGNEEREFPAGASEQLKRLMCIRRRGNSDTSPLIRGPNNSYRSIQAEARHFQRRSTTPSRGRNLSFGSKKAKRSWGRSREREMYFLWDD